MIIIRKACHVMLGKLKNITNEFQTNESLIKASDTTIENSYDITLENEDYTLGKVLEYILYQKHYNRDVESGSDKKLTFCGFRKPHPHAKNSVIRLGFVDPTPTPDIIAYLTSAITDAITLFEYISNEFSDD